MTKKFGMFALLVLFIGFWANCVRIDRAVGAQQAKKSTCPGPGQDLAIHNMIRSSLGKLKEKSEKVIRTAEEWKSFWSQVNLPLTPTPIDFNKDMIIAVSAGTGSGVIEMEITGVEQKKACVCVKVVERVLPPKMKGLLPTLLPFHIIRISSARGPIVFEYTQTTDALDPAEPNRK
jgi:hypothetical protein